MRISYPCLLQCICKPCEPCKPCKLCKKEVGATFETQRGLYWSYLFSLWHDAPHPVVEASVVISGSGESKIRDLPLHRLGFLFTSSAFQSNCNFSWYISEIFKTLIWTCWRYHIWSLSGSIACAVPPNFPRNWVSSITEVSLLS